MFGTPGYMAPEQCLDAGKVDHRADLYAIGCIFYRCLCGRAPFGVGGIEVLQAQLRHEFAAPAQIQPGIPSALNALIVRLMDKSPENRFASCTELLTALDQLGGTVLVADEQDITTRQVQPGQTPPDRTPGLSAGSNEVTIVDMQDADLVPLAPEQQCPVPVMPSPLPPARANTEGSVPSVNGVAISRRPLRAGRSWLLWGLATVVLSAIATAAIATVLRVDGPPKERPASTESHPAASQEPPQPPADPDEEFDQHLERAKEAIQNEAWQTARAILERAQTLPLHDNARTAEAQRLLQHVERERQHQALLEGLQAQGTSNIEAAVKAYREISEQSIYRSQIELAHKQMRTRWLGEQHSLAAQLSQTGACNSLTALAAEVVRFFPEDAPPFDARVQACRQRKHTHRQHLPDRRKRRAFLATEIHEAVRTGQYRHAHELCRRKRDAIPLDDTTVSLCGIAACRRKNQAAAQRILKRLPNKTHQDAVVQTCLKEGIALALGQRQSTSRSTQQDSE